MIDTESALWEAVGANPACALARGILADWYDEQGDADTAAGLRATAEKVPENGRGDPCWTWHSDLNGKLTGAHRLPMRLYAALTGKARTDAAGGPLAWFEVKGTTDRLWRDYPTARTAVADLVAAWVKGSVSCDPEVNCGPREPEPCPECGGRGKTHRPYPGGRDRCDTCSGTGNLAPGQCSEMIQK